MDKLFLVILNNTLVAGWMILAVIVFRFICKKAPKWVNCLLWGLVGIRLAFPFSIESIFSLIPSAKPIPSDIEYAAIPQIDAGIQSVNTVINPVLANSFAASETASVNPMQVVIIFLSYAWIIGVAGLVAYAFVSFILLKRRVKQAEPLDQGIFQCKSIESPFILGVIKPRIYVPDELDDEAYACVMEHERMHIKRGDHVWKPLGFFILSVYWFNPLCWLAYILLCRDIEFACDEKVTKDKDKAWKAKYCQVLLDCSSQRRMISACPVAFGEVSVKDRVKSVIRYKKPAFWMIIASIIIVVIVVVCFMTNPKNDNPMEGNDSENNIVEAGEYTPKDTLTVEELASGEEEPKFQENQVIIDHEYHVDESRLFVEMWAKAFCNRDGEMIYKYSSDHVRDSLNMEAVNGEYDFGWSSPWPWNSEWFRIDAISDSAATIYYYALTSDPHVTVWRQMITYGRDNETVENTVKTISTEQYENIVLSSQFDMAYGKGLFWMDYYENGAGEVLNQNAMLSSSTLYQDLFEPDTAARNLLNLLPNERKIPIEIADGENENEKILYITFMEDNQIRVVKMIRPWGKEGIWIPFGWTNEEERENDYLPLENINISTPNNDKKEQMEQHLAIDARDVFEGFDEIKSADAYVEYHENSGKYSIKLLLESDTDISDQQYTKYFDYLNRIYAQVELMMNGKLVANPVDENLDVDYVEKDGHYIVDGDMVLVHKMVLIGQASTAEYPVQYIVLTNDPDITWEQVDRSYNSNSPADWLPGAIIIGMKILQH